MNGLNKILLEGRVEDAKQYFENAVGGMSDESEEIFGHFVYSDPSGNHKYLMWMVKMYDKEWNRTTPNDIASLVQRFHKNVNRLTIAFIMNMDMFAPSGKISTSPKNIDSYDDISQLERVLDEVDSVQTKKQKDEEAKSGVDKLYEDDRWLLVRPNTYEGSCYYGSSTKWCTASKDAPQHFDSYSKTGNLYYIIDKTKDVGDFFKIALHKNWDGQEDWYDRADNELRQETEDAIRSLLPIGLIKSLEKDHGDAPQKKLKTLQEFQGELSGYIGNNPKLQTISTESGIWEYERDSFSGVWSWNSKDDKSKRAHIQATPFWDGRNEIPFDYIDEEGGQDFSIVAGPESMETTHLRQHDYLNPITDRYRADDWNARAFLRQIYFPLLKQQLNKDFFKDLSGSDYSTWTPSTDFSTFQFKYPPREGTMTQKFTDYLKGNPRRTSQQFYDEVLGYPKPRGHNNSFFSSIKDSGIVKMERQGRQFVYSLGPNYTAWTKGMLLRT